MATATKQPKTRKKLDGAIRIPSPLPGPRLVRGYETDPGEGANPTGGPITLRPTPDPGSTPLPMKMPTAPAPAGLYPPGTEEFRYWVAAEALERGRDMWHAYAPALAAWNSKVGTSLPVKLDDGDDLNAYYDRDSLSFFHSVVAGRTVYSGESPDVLCHELGHAVLDAIQPRLYGSALAEQAAFHEAFGDISALLAALKLPGVRQELLAGCGPIYRNSRLSRCAEGLGWGIRQSYPDSVEADCLRNAANGFVWQSPTTLPFDAPAAMLSSEAHSFSRVFTSAFLLALSNVFDLQKFRNEAMLVAVVNEMGGLLVRAVESAALVPHYYAAVATAMIAHAPAAHRTAIRLAFQSKNILRPIVITKVGRMFPPRPGAPIAGASVDMVAATPTEPVLLSLEEFGYAGRLLVDAGDAPVDEEAMAPLGFDARPVRVPSPADAARHFVAGLLIREQILGADENPNEARSARGALKTHRIVVEGGRGRATYRLERIRID